MGGWGGALTLMRPDASPAVKLQAVFSSCAQRRKSTLCQQAAAVTDSLKGAPGCLITSDLSSDITVEAPNV